MRATNRLFPPETPNPRPPAGVAPPPPGSPYTASKGEPLAAVVRRYWPETSYLTRAEMDTALREANHLGKAVYLKAGQQITIPGLEPQPTGEKSISVPADYEVRAVYMTGPMAG